MRHKLKQHNVQLVRKLQPELPMVMGESGQLEQAFLNLILNAVEAMPDGGTLTIVSRAVHLPRKSAHATHVAVEFSDDFPFSHDQNSIAHGDEFWQL